MAAEPEAQGTDVPAFCKSCKARLGGLFGGLSARQLAELAKASSRHEISAGEELGDDGNYSIILSGVVKLTRSLPDGRQQIVGFHFAPDFLGGPFKAKGQVKVEALTNVRVCLLPGTVIDRMINETPRLGRRLLKHALNELDDARDWLAALGRKTASEKVASFLLMLARNIDPARHGQCSIDFELPLKRSDVADFLGLATETVSREFSRLRSSGVIQIADNRHINIASIAQLQERCGG